jgi:hypothetical protein
VFQFVGGVQRLWTAHTTKLTWQGEDVARAALQWYELDIPTHAVSQQGAFGQPGAYYFFPAIQTDLRRNAYVGFTRSTQTGYASFRQTGRLATDPNGSLQGSSLVKDGVAAYTGGRWGDYLGNARDGGDANRVWLYGEFADVRNTWGTWVCSVSY